MKTSRWRGSTCSRSKKTRTANAKPRKLTTANYHVDDFDWSNDGSRIAFSHVKSPVANDWPTSDVSIVEVASGKSLGAGKLSRCRVCVRSIHPMANRSLCSRPMTSATLGAERRDPDLSRRRRSAEKFCWLHLTRNRLSPDGPLTESASISANLKALELRSIHLDVAANRIEEIKTTPSRVFGAQSQPHRNDVRFCPTNFRHAGGCVRCLSIRFHACSNHST